MTMPERRCRIAIVVLGAALGSAAGPDAAWAQHSALVTFNVNVQVEKLHPAVLSLVVGCSGNNAVTNIDGMPITSIRKDVVNGSYSGVVATRLRFDNLDNPVNRTAEVTCRLMFINTGWNTMATALPAVATAAQPLSITAGNWTAVGTGSTIAWTQTVVIPNAAP